MVEDHNRRVTNGAGNPVISKSAVPEVSETIIGNTPTAPTSGALARCVVNPTTEESKLNKSEREWLGILRSRCIQRIGVQNITLKIGDDCRYTPDFNGIGPGGEAIFWEVKGFMRDDALVKLKVAARAFSQFRFILCRKKGGKWEEEEVHP